MKFDEAPKDFNMGPFGDWKDYEQFFDPSRGDVMLPWDDEEKSSKDPRILAAMKLESDKKRVNIKHLFGSKKPFGLLPKKEIPEGMKSFHYERLFGKQLRKEKRAAEAAAAVQKQ